jgi:Protein of unknown function (DUF3237)
VSDIAPPDIAPPEIAPPSTTFLFRIDASLAGTDAFVVPQGPAGTRLVAGVSSGRVSGPRLHGSLRPGISGDWVTIRQDGSWSLDVRSAITTDDGANVLYSYHGVATPVDGGRMRIRGAPRFETGDDRYAWLNTVQAVAVGVADPRTRTALYDIYALD